MRIDSSSGFLTRLRARVRRLPDVAIPRRGGCGARRTLPRGGHGPEELAGGSPIWAAARQSLWRRASATTAEHCSARRATRVIASCTAALRQRSASRPGNSAARRRQSQFNGRNRLSPPHFATRIHRHGQGAANKARRANTVADGRGTDIALRRPGCDHRHRDAHRRYLGRGGCRPDAGPEPIWTVYGEVGQMFAVGGDARVKIGVQGSIDVKARW